MANKGAPSGELARRIARATHPRDSASVLKQLSYMKIPQATIADVKLPGYQYDQDTARFMRVAEAAVAAATDLSLRAHATKVAEALVAAQKVDIDKRRTGLHLVSANTIDADRATHFVKGGSNAPERAMRLLQVLAVSAAPLAERRANGNWDALPNGDMRAAGARDVLSRPFAKGQPLVEAVGDVAWHTHTVSKEPEAILWRRREPIADITHAGVLVEVRDGSGKANDRLPVDRGFTLTQDTYLMVHPEIAGDIGLAELTEAYDTHGDGYEDMIAPVAGFVLAEQTLALSSLAAQRPG